MAELETGPQWGSIQPCPSPPCPGLSAIAISALECYFPSSSTKVGKAVGPKQHGPWHYRRGRVQDYGFSRAREGWVHLQIMGGQQSSVTHMVLEFPQIPSIMCSLEVGEYSCIAQGTQLGLCCRTGLERRYTLYLTGHLSGTREQTCGRFPGRNSTVWYFTSSGP